MSKVLTAAIGVVAALTLAACGSSDQAATAATASIKSELLQQSASGATAFKFSDGQAQCAASTIVKNVGTKNLQHYGLLDDKFQGTPKTLDDVTMSKGDATTVVNALIDCLGEANFTQALADAVNKTITGNQAQAQRDCLKSKLTATALRPMLIATLSGDTAAAQKFVTEITSCIPASSPTP